MIPARPSGGGSDRPWPRLRGSLKLELTMAEGGGFPGLVISDPVRGKYFKVGWPQSGLFLFWNEAGNAASLKVKMQEHYGASASDGDVEQVASFIFKNELSETDEKGGWGRFHHSAKASRHSVMKSLMHNYLFFRLPLLHPDGMLKALLPRVSFAFRAPFWLFVALVAAVGLYLTTRQWSDVVAAFYNSMQFQHLFFYAAALLVLKAIHEMGHALTTVYYGCRVPSMGVAFMLGTPVLYTDTSDSWRLSDKRHRLAIVFAGVAAESIVAAFALLLWPLLPEGALRQLTFGFATAAIAMSLAVNLNPLMRFDGYFALSDYLQVPNLQNRAFALASWHLRETLFGLSQPPPEAFAPRKQRTLILYAYAVWIYRFFLYLGIAYVVYVMAGKALGIVLGLFELVIFILLPIWRELAWWWKERSKIAMTSRGAITASICALAAVVACSPCLTTVESPGVLVAAQEQELHLPNAAQITAVFAREGDFVEEGAVLFKAASPEIDHKLRKAQFEARLLELQVSRLTASRTESEQAVVLTRALKAAREKVEGLRRERAELTIRAPFAGRIGDLDTALTAGTWVAQEQLLARITSPQGASVKALVADTDVRRIREGNEGVFIADEADLASRPVVLRSIAPASDGKLAEPALADMHGGPVAAIMQDRVLRAREGWVEVGYVTDSVAPSRVVRGVVRVKAEPISPFALVWRQVGRVLVREQGF